MVTMSAKKQLSNADGRPRAHLWSEENGYSYSIGPVGVRFKAASPGDAVECALAAIDYQPAVIIWEGASARKASEKCDFLL
jgi:hypothetical protein